jgi:hypothetical protein
MDRHYMTITTGSLCSFKNEMLNKQPMGKPKDRRYKKNSTASKTIR